MWQLVERFLSFTGNEKRATFSLILIAGAAFVVPLLYFNYYLPETSAVTNNWGYDNELAAFEKELEQKRQLAEVKVSDNQDTTAIEVNPYADIDISHHFVSKHKPVIEYFYFDPNKIGVEEWQKLGFTERQALGIENAKAKGFKFYKPEDLKKIYAVGEENYPRLAPYIQIEQQEKTTYVKAAYTQTSKPKFVIDINTADSSLFERQKGIGPSLASRIIRRRERLGGFISVEQISEIWGMPDSTYQNLKSLMVVNNPNVVKININSADFKTMGAHPYINYTYARVIEAYRKEHGSFTSAADLRKISAIPDSIYQRMLPYISAP